MKGSCNPERDDEILRESMAGVAKREIARRHGLSATRVSQIIYKGIAVKKHRLQLNERRKASTDFLTWASMVRLLIHNIEAIRAIAEEKGMRDLEDEKRIKEYMAAKMTHIKMYNECMNLADGLDVAKFAELVRADEREKVAQWMIERGFATGHGDSIEDLLKELEWQVKEREREACAMVCENMERNGAWITKVEAAAAIRSRGEK